MSTSREWRSRLNRLTALAASAAAGLERESEELESLKLHHQAAVDARKILQEVAARVQTEAHHKLAAVVSQCLAGVFPEAYKVVIDFQRRRGKTEADFYYDLAGRRLDPRVNSGGVREVAALALRIASLALTLPPSRSLLILDEPFLGLSDANVQRMAELVMILSRELSSQWLIATHHSKFRPGSVVEL
jgi:hypothetical protein